jgi:prepilin-type N-terminal cleavage/methylation domain-containing protein
VRRGYTLLELLIVIAIMGLITAAVTRAWSSSLDFEQRLRAGREVADRSRSIEDRLSALLRQAYLSPDANDSSTYFIGADVMAEEASENPTNTLTFTIAGKRIPSTLMSSDDDFESLNNRLGPQGGIAEITLGTTPVGQSSETQGLFIREQRPSDGDPTQGGYEQLFSNQIDEITFEFFDGAQWLPSWDTRTGEKRLPAAIRVTYKLTGDEDEHIRVVKLPLSDVTPLNPLTTESAG